jgi:hypothetical protein
MSANTFCRHLSNGQRFFVEKDKVTWWPCCYWDGPTFPIEEFVSARQKINSSTPWANKECNKCQREEPYKPVGNLRKTGDKFIPADIPNTKAGWIDLQIDYICNGGCLICSPQYSSYLQSESSKAKEFVIEKAAVSMKQHVDNIFSTVDASELKLLHVLGGEPFLSDVDKFAFEHISNPSECHLRYTTNGTIFPQQDRLNMWSQFKTVTLNISIDDIGPRFEYLRYPLSWNKVESNIKRLIDETDDHVLLQVNHTVTPFSIYYYDEFIAWRDQVFPKEKLGFTHVHTAYGQMNVGSCNESLRKKVLEKYGPEHLLVKMLADNPFKTTRNFWEHVRKMDQRRNQDWRIVFPDLVGVIGV